MKVPILDKSKKEIGQESLPQQFSEEIRPDLIKRAVLSINSAEKQPYGSDPRAGKKSSAELSRRRHSYKTSYGYGISRVPRKIMSRRGLRMNWVGAFAPGTVGGRKAHPPKAEKNIEKKINKKERRKAIRSAISATMIKDLVSKNHSIPDIFPFIIDDKIESLNKTKDVRNTLIALGLEKELQRIEHKSIRGGKGKKRGRRYVRKTGPLIVVSKDCSLIKSARNIPGVSARTVKSLNAKALSSGISPGRLTIWTKSAVKELSEKKLFM